MKFKIIQKSRVIVQTIEFVFEYEGVNYVGRIEDNGEGNTKWILDEDENEIEAGDVYDTFNNISFDQWRELEEDDILDTEEE
jgi:hypothetical protein